MSRAFTVAIVCGIVVTLSGLGGVVAGVMVRSWPMTVASLVSAVGGLGMATFGLIGKKQLPPRP
jgi:hypothetical protein